MDPTIINLETLTSRLNEMEISQKRMKWMSISLLVLTALVVGEAIFAPRRRAVVEAERFVVKDSNGRLRAELGLAACGLPQLNLYDEKGFVQVGLQVYADHAASLAFHDVGQTQLSLEASGDGSAGLRLMDREDVTRTSLYMLQGGRSGLSINHDRESVMMGINPGTSAGVLVTDSRGKGAGSVGGSALTPHSFGLVKLGGVDDETPVARASIETRSPRIEQAATLMVGPPMPEEAPASALSQSRGGGF